MSDSDSESSFIRHVEAGASAAADDFDMDEGSAFVYPQVCRIDSCGYYAALGVSVRATSKEIRQAFLDLSQRYHTDKHVLANPDMQARMSERFKDLQEAYTVLMDERQRAAYDAAGEAGMNHLTIIPLSEVKRESIIQHVCLLEREAKLRRMSKMLAASSHCELQYNVTLLKELPHVVRRLCAACATVATAESSQDENHRNTSATRSNATPTPPDDRHDNLQHAQHKGDVHASNSEVGAMSLQPPLDEEQVEQQDDEQQTPPISSSALSMSQLTVFEAEVNGKERLVALLPDEMEAQIRRTIAARSHTATSSVAPAHTQAGEPIATALARTEAQRCALLASRILAQAILPSRMSGEYGFRHMLDQSTGVHFRLRASSTAGSGAGADRAAPFAVRTKLEHQDQITSYAVKFRTTLGDLKTTLHLSRALSPLWRLETSLELFRSMQPLGKLKLMLERALSTSVVLRNTLVLSWCRPGYFKTLVAFAHAGRQAFATMHIGLGVLSFGVQSLNATMWRLPTDFGAVTAERCTAREEKHDTGVPNQEQSQPNSDHSRDYARASTVLSRRCRARISENMSCFCFPLSAASSLRYEIWYRHSALHRMGIGFTTTIPFALHRSFSSAPSSSSTRIVNGVVLLYARGAHSVSIPILLCTSHHLTHAVGWLLLPALLCRLTRTVYMMQALRLDRAYYVRQRLRHVAEVDVARELARQEQAALEPAVLRGRALEEGRGGLVVVHARYGVLSPRYTSTSSPTSWHNDDASDSSDYSVLGCRVWAMPRRIGAAGRKAAQRAQRAAQCGSECVTQALSWCACRVTGLLKTCGMMSGRMRHGGGAMQNEYNGAEVAHKGGVSSRSRAGSSIFDSVLLQTHAGQGREEDEDARQTSSRRDEERCKKQDEEEGILDEDVTLYMDVTVPVQNLVHNSKLTLPAGTKSKLAGFCDTDPYTPERKQLKIVYRFRHRRHEVVVDDEDAVELPQQSHLVGAG